MLAASTAAQPPVSLATLSNLPDPFSPAQLAKAAGVTTWTVLSWIRRGYLPQPMRFSKRTLRFDRATVLAHLQGMQ